MERTTRQQMEQWSTRELACFACDAGRVLSQLCSDPGAPAEERASWERLVHECRAVLAERRAAEQGRGPEKGQEARA